jgi:mono/diheme cytochrome c family protein
MRLSASLAFSLVLLVTVTPCHAGSAPVPGASVDESARAEPRRGALLYDAACVACHKTEVHWRDKRVVKDWPGLLREVARWQRIAGQTWRSEDIEDVAAYLNCTFYHLPCPTPGCSAQTRLCSAAGLTR